MEEKVGTGRILTFSCKTRGFQGFLIHGHSISGVFLQPWNGWHRIRHFQGPFQWTQASSLTLVTEDSHPQLTIPWASHGFKSTESAGHVSIWMFWTHGFSIVSPSPAILMLNIPEKSNLVARLPHPARGSIMVTWTPGVGDAQRRCCPTRSREISPSFRLLVGI